MEDGENVKPKFSRGERGVLGVYPLIIIPEVVCR
jgi:hypothetical protein